MRKNNLLLFLLSIVIASCGTYKLRKDVKLENLPAPPGTIELSENQYFDKTEATNFHWLEYLYWTKRVYGRDSKEYQQILPDTTVWTNLDGKYSQQVDFYLRDPVYRDFPVVGISYRQAVDYCKWRSDRVMEYMLVKFGVFDYKTDVPADSVFTIEKYFKGEYYGIQPNPHFGFYPHYSLPDPITYQKVIIFADSLNVKNSHSCRKKHCDVSDLGRVCMENRRETEVYPYSPHPTKEVFSCGCKKDKITHLQGNVREMTDLEGTFFGASFIDSCSVLDYVLRTDSFLINSYTGFRAKCEYRKWGN
ncbi:SUMF1/EgtB/PvdO family nonheme iron enzyme [Fluviicola taffensis]|uniref:SUMF1/EgtB/PvdO family nonheme iron enzyme n=1 Tax=Fluviicola taffensis TaxID=191579 RepID=UPI003137E66A